MTVPQWITEPRAPTDTELIDFLQSLTNEAQYTGRVVLRGSVAGRGWRLHETSKAHAVPDVRQAIIRYAVDAFSDDVDAAITSAASAHEVRPQGLPVGGHPGCAGGLCEEEMDHGND